jgi:hypothetical protein
LPKRFKYAWRALCGHGRSNPKQRPWVNSKIYTSDFDAAALYGQFLAAREEAIMLTDRFASCPREDPDREALWDIAMRQTHTARLLLEEWLSLRQRDEKRQSTISTSDAPRPDEVDVLLEASLP